MLQVLNRERERAFEDQGMPDTGCSFAAGCWRLYVLCFLPALET